MIWTKKKNSPKNSNLKQRLKREKKTRTIEKTQWVKARKSRHLRSIKMCFRQSFANFTFHKPLSSCSYFLWYTKILFLLHSLCSLLLVIYLCLTFKRKVHFFSCSCLDPLDENELGEESWKWEISLFVQWYSTQT